MKYFRLDKGKKVEISRNFCVELIRNRAGGDAEKILREMSFGTKHQVGNDVIIKEMEDED